MKFTLQKKDTQTKARACQIETDHGSIDTPIFMTVGTAATVKGIDQITLKNEINPDIILAIVEVIKFIHYQPIEKLKRRELSLNLISTVLTIFLHLKEPLIFKDLLVQI